MIIHLKNRNMEKYIFRLSEDGKVHRWNANVEAWMVTYWKSLKELKDTYGNTYTDKILTFEDTWCEPFYGESF